MNLLLDIGNSRCKYAVIEKGEVQKYGTQNYAPFGKLYAVKSLCDQYVKAEKIVIASVLSKEMNSQINETLSNKDHRNVYFLVPEKELYGVRLAYDDPSMLGVDRIAALIAAKEKHPGTSCIVDCGTAVTIDALDADGRHMGGVILPGIKTMRKALMSNTKIQTGEAKVGFNVFSKTTEGAIYTGCISAVVGGIEYVVNKMATDYDKFDQIIFTGGDAELLGSYLSIKMVLDATLVLDGLKAVAQNI